MIHVLSANNKTDRRRNSYAATHDLFSSYLALFIPIMKGHDKDTELSATLVGRRFSSHDSKVDCFVYPCVIVR